MLRLISTAGYYNKGQGYWIELYTL